MIHAAASLGHGHGGIHGKRISGKRSRSAAETEFRILHHAIDLDLGHGSAENGRNGDTIDNAQIGHDGLHSRVQIVIRSGCSIGHDIGDELFIVKVVSGKSGHLGHSARVETVHRGNVHATGNLGGEAIAKDLQIVQTALVRALNELIGNTSLIDKFDGADDLGREACGACRLRLSFTHDRGLTVHTESENLLTVERQRRLAAQSGDRRKSLDFAEDVSDEFFRQIQHCGGHIIPPLMPG